MKNKASKRIVNIASIFFILLVVLLACCTIGRINISFLDVLKSLLNYIFGCECKIDRTIYNAVILMRLPRIIMSMLVGAALSVSGCVYQSIFNNNLISPDLLGVTSGSCVGAAFAILLGLSGVSIIFSSFVFGIIAVVIALLIPILMKNTSNLSLILSGIIVSAIFSSILGLVKYIVDSLEKLEAITFWIMGSFSSVSMNDVVLTFPIMTLSIIILYLMRYRINIISLGSAESGSLGLNYKKNRIMIIVFATLLTACSTAICGTVSWIGLIIPHIVRLIVGTDNRRIVPWTCVLGASILPGIDTMCRTISISEIPISIISAALGAVVYALLLIVKGRKQYDRI